MVYNLLHKEIFKYCMPIFVLVYLNNDGKSLFGTPWEMMFIDTYLVRTKSGNLLGYSSQFNYVPDLGLSEFM